MKFIFEINTLLKRIQNQYYKLITIVWYKLIFKTIGKNSLIIKPMKLDNPIHIDIGENVIINKLSWLFCTNSDSTDSKIIIEDGTQIGHFAHIVAMNKIHIGKNVLIADKVYISDNNHNYQDINIPIMNQDLTFKGSVDIGEGAWIGENVSIIGAKIGKNSIIGSNSVVLSDIDDYSIAVGCPAKVIKKFSLEFNRWIRI